jgi:5-oxoprolinase (ATP-hydrolysing)
MHGGEDGQRGLNIWVKQPRDEDGDFDEVAREAGIPKVGERRINIGGKATVWMGKGDRLVLHTPGGGGWGEANSEVAAQA